ncbi:MAG: sugar transporter [Ferruginibacter sp.]|nr:sugar transporter [Ferruginibacter sp.]
MKRITFALVLVLFFAAANAQQKISWSYAAKKLADNKYEIHITANPPSGWHIYSQLTPDGGPIPTTFKFNNNALLALQGKVGEKGKVITYFDKNFKVNVKYFEGKADFVQVVMLKGKIKTNVSGEVESMICNDRVCMPPTTEKFSISLN